ncbi:MAG: hypothetical protein ACYTAF_14555 [Planctomycetota bacterium]|jgi:hypothetical protein
MVRKVAAVVLWTGIALTVAVPPAAALIDAQWGRDVVYLAPAFSEDVVEVNRLARLEGDSVAELYGIPANGGRPIRVVFPDGSRLVVPTEDPSLLLLKVDKAEGNPLQARSIWFFSFVIVALSLVVSSVGLIVLWLLRP